MEGKKVTFEMLPENIIMKILKYLPVPDMLNIRLCSYWLYQASKSQVFYEQIVVRIKPLKKSNEGYLKHLLLECGSCSSLDLTSCGYSDLEIISKYLAVVRDVAVDMKDLPVVCEYSKNVHRLVLNMDIELETDDTFDLMIIKDLKNLDDLVLRNKYKKASSDCQIIHSITLIDILSHVKIITKFGLEGFDFTANELLEKDKDTQKIISTASNILQWSFCSVIGRDGIFLLPESVKSVVCRNMSLGIIALNNSCVERLILDQAWIHSDERFTINSLKYLEIHNSKFSYKSFNFRNLETLYIDSCWFSACNMAILAFKFSIKVLVLQSIKGLNENIDRFLEAVTKCKLLKQVKFIHMKQEARTLLDIIKWRIDMHVDIFSI